MNRLSIFFLALTILFSSCDQNPSDIQSPDKDKIERTLDSLSATGEHGFKVFVFIQGRIKSILVENPPFIVNVSELNDDLIQQPILFRILNEQEYSLSYLQRNEEIVMKGTFALKSGNRDLTLMVQPDESLSKPATLNTLKYIDYSLRIVKY